MSQSFETPPDGDQTTFAARRSSAECDRNTSSADSTGSHHESTTAPGAIRRTPKKRLATITPTFPAHQRLCDTRWTLTEALPQRLPWASLRFQSHMPFCTLVPNLIRSPSGANDLFKSPVTHISEQVILINLARIRGVEAVCARVPSEPGVYAWFKNYLPPDPVASTAEEFADYLINEATREHCLPRHGRLAPLYAVELRSSKQIATVKRDAICRLCTSLNFRRTIAEMLGTSIFFQQPLYVGKADCLTDRIRQHIAIGSKLRRRLSKVEIDIDRSLLVCLPVERVSYSTEHSSGEANEDEFLSSEAVVEELLSKLFHPLFTARYG